VLENVERGIFQIPFRLDRVAGTVRALLVKYRDVPMDLADDASSILRRSWERDGS